MNKKIENNKIVTKARPFIRVWNEIQSKCSVLTKTKEVGTYTLITLALGETFGNLFDYIREGNSDFLFIDGIGLSGVRVKGLLCIDGNRQMATSEDCFFIGEATVDELVINEQLLLTARQLDEFVGEGARFLICKVAVTEQSQAFDITISSFLRTLKRFAEENK